MPKPQEEQKQQLATRAFPFLLPSFFRDEDFFSALPFSHGGEERGLTVCEDSNNVIVEAALPGLEAKNVEVTFENGTLWIKGAREEQEEDKKKNYYRKASQSYSYSVSVPGDVDTTKEPIAEYKNGLMTVKFPRLKKEKARKIPVKAK